MANFFWGVGSTLVLLLIGASWAGHRAGEYQRVVADRIDRFLDGVEQRVANEISRQIERKLEDEFSGRAAARRMM